MANDPIILEIMKMQQEVKDSLVQHPAATQEAYMRRVGIYEGLDQALAVIHGLEPEDI